MGRRLEKNETHATKSEKKKKRKLAEEDVALLRDNGPSGWEEVETIGKPQNVAGEI